MIKFGILFATFNSISFGLLVGISAAQSNYSTNELNELNQFFRQEYAKSRGRKLRGVEPIVIVRGDFLVLIRSGKREEGSRVNPHYHDLKALSHIPLAVFCILSGRTENKLDRSTQDSLQTLLSKTKVLKNKLPKIFADKNILQKQLQLIEHSEEIVNDVIATGTIKDSSIKDYVRTVRPLIVGNASESARFRLQNYHDQMKKWKQKLSDDEWKRLYVLIPGAVMSRKNSLAVSYFAKLFEQSSEGGRVIYAESQFDERQDLNLLGTHLLDSDIGRVFFDDKSRMKRDLLGPYANIHLDSLDYSMFRK